MKATKRVALTVLAMLTMLMICGLLVSAAGRSLPGQRFVAGQLALQQQPAYASSAQCDMLVNESHPLPTGYAPGNLVCLYEQSRTFDLATSDIYLDQSAFEAANRMFKDAKQDGIDGFILTSGYRTEDKQRQLYEADTDGLAATPGASEHQTGLAFDVTARRDGGGFEMTDQFAWLDENCWDYGFILRYPEDGEQITGFAYEPWHYRYVGCEIAQAIRANDWTLEEYCEEMG